MNTARFNNRINRVAKARGSAVRSSNNRIRGPAHGCQGSAKSQRRLGGTSTQVLRRADLAALNRKGDLAQLQAEISDSPDIAIQQTFAADSHDFDMPMGCDHADSRPCMDDDSDSDWEAEDEAEQLKEKLRERAGYRIRREDYRTRRDRTDIQWKHWETQRESMLDAYMTWALREKDANAPPEARSLNSEMGITVIDLFGECKDCSRCILCD